MLTKKYIFQYFKVFNIIFSQKKFRSWLSERLSAEQTGLLRRFIRKTSLASGSRKKVIFFSVRTTKRALVVGPLKKELIRGFPSQYEW